MNIRIFVLACVFEIIYCQSLLDSLFGWPQAPTNGQNPTLTSPGDIFSTLLSSVPMSNIMGPNGIQDSNTLATVTKKGASLMQDIPIANIVYGVEALRQSGAFKTIGLTSNKKETLPMSGTPNVKGQCYTPTKAQDNTILGGFTVCIPSGTLNIDPNKVNTLPRLGYEKGRDAPNECRAALMSKNSQFDGYYCVTTQYNDTTCRIKKYQIGPGKTIYEAKLIHDGRLNNAVIRCLVEEYNNGMLKATTDVSYEVSIKSINNPDTSIASQTAEIMSVMPTIFTPNNIENVYNSVGIQSNNVTDNNQMNTIASNIGNFALGFITSMVNQTSQAKKINAQSYNGQFASPSTPAHSISNFVKTWNSITSGNTNITEAISKV